jgi:HupE / UreJ protein
VSATARLFARAACLCACLFLALPVWAHKPSDSYLTLKVEENRISGQWDIALRDLDFALGLDADGDGAITWGELKARHADIAAYAAARLSVKVDSRVCKLQAGVQQVDEHTDGAYTVLPFELACTLQPGRGGELSVGYSLFADLDPQHRGLLKLQTAADVRTAVLVPQRLADAPAQVFALAQASAWQAFVGYLREGVWHIWIGFDHILFLLSLLLPAVGSYVLTSQVRTQLAAPAAWTPAARFAPVFWDVLRVVTAFTVAHSITLSLATLGWVSLPSKLVESAIAASVVLAAVNNVWPVFLGKRWIVAFVFGLIHGFGFASVLAELGLPQEALALALLGFNVGVELGQLAIVAVFLPLAYALRHTRFYKRGVLWAGSLLVAAIALAWLVERVFDLALLPGS